MFNILNREWLYYCKAEKCFWKNYYGSIIIIQIMIKQIKVFRMTIFCSPKRTACQLLKDFLLCLCFISNFFTSFLTEIMIYFSVYNNNFYTFMFFIIAWFIIFVLFFSRNQKLQDRRDQFTVSWRHHRQHGHPIHSACSRYNAFYKNKVIPKLALWY